MNMVVMTPGGGGGGPSSGGGGGSESTVVSKEEEVEQVEGSDESGLELGLGLSLGFMGSNNTRMKDDDGGSNVGVGNKRAASPTGASQVVGWPPIRAYRMNSMANQAKSIATAEHSAQFDEAKQKDVYRTDGKAKGHKTAKDRVPLKGSLFVKVNKDGVAIGRKVDINAHSGYESLAWALEEMFIDQAAERSSGNELMLMPKVVRPSKLLDGSSDYVLTYEDKDGDWMLVGDVPWGMFINSVKRLRIMRTSEAKGLTPRLEERSAKRGPRPI